MKLALAACLLLSANAARAGDDAGQPPLQHTLYGDPSPRDAFIAQKALERVAGEGRTLFHDPTRLGSATGTSCARCHPDAAATHAESYPKFHRQLQRVALLRDAINWCLVNSAEGRPLRDDDPRLKAIEVYLTVQRAGRTLEPGKR